MIEHQEFVENEALRLGTAGEHPILLDLRTQLNKIESRKRKFTEVGFYTELILAGDAVPAQFTGTLGIHGIGGFCDSMRDGFSMILWAPDGRIKTIEGLANEGSWDLTTYPILSIDLRIRSALSSLGLPS